MWVEKNSTRNALLAQLDRVTGYEPVGQGFESLAARQTKSTHSGAFLFGALICKGLERALRKQSCGLFLARSVAEPIALPNKARFEM